VWGISLKELYEGDFMPNLAVISLDGTPKSLLERFFGEGLMPNLRSLTSRGDFRELHSVAPTVSAVAWASYMTGLNPGKHGIFGFADLQSGSYNLYFPNAAHLKGATIWEILSHAGKRVFSLNVPVTYPPKPVNGIMISGFLAPSLDKVAYPQVVSRYLKTIDYRIDADAAVARTSKEEFLEELDTALEKREQAALHFMASEDWDFFHVHIMETDRINHFLLKQIEDDNSALGKGFRRFYSKLDATVGRLLEKIGDDASVMILSDHGFCPIKSEVQLGRYMADKGWTTPAPDKPESLGTNWGASKAFAMVPGRVRLNVAGREPNGVVPAEQYEAEREKLAADLMELTDPKTGDKVLKGVLKGEEIFSCESGRSNHMPDLVAIPVDGYDLKMGVTAANVFKDTALEGMHTYDDAFVFARGFELPDGELDIIQLAPAILRHFGVEVPRSMDEGGALNLVRKGLGES